MLISKKKDIYIFQENEKVKRIHNLLGEPYISALEKLPIHRSMTMAKKKPW